MYLTKYLFTVRAASLTLHKCLYRLLFCLYHYKIAYYLSHTSEDKNIYIMVSKSVNIYNMLLGYYTLMLVIVSYRHT